VVAKTDQGVYDYAFERGAVDVADIGRRPRSGRLRMSGREISSRLPSPTAPSTDYVPFRRWRRTTMISKNLGQWLRSGHYSRKGI
jgi:hypothetical protein